MSSEENSWPEVKPPYNPGPIWNFRRGYRVDRAGRHESDQQYRAFQFYLNLGSSRTYEATSELADVGVPTISKWATTYEWHRRAAAWDKKQISMVLKEANNLERRKHRDAIEQFRQTNEEQARLMMDVSSDLMGIIQKRIQKAQDEGEDIPLHLVAGLMRAAANISDSGRQAWAISLGVNELMQVVEQELEEVNVVDISEDVYDIPLDE